MLNLRTLDLWQILYPTNPRTFTNTLMYASTTSQKKLQNVILLFFSSGIIQHCLEFTPWFLYKSIHFYNAHVCVTKLSLNHQVQQTNTFGHEQSFVVCLFVF